MGPRLRPKSREFSEAGREVARHLLLADARPLQDAGDHGQHLTWTGGLDQIVIDPAPDRLGQGAVLFGLGDHHDARVRIFAAQDGQDLEAAAPGHLLVEHDQVVVVLAQEREGVVPVADRVHVVAPLLQEQQMRAQAVDLVVDPENALGARGGE